MTIKPDGTDGLQVKRVFDASGTSPRNITIANHLSNAGGTNLKNGNLQIGAVYASRGLDDKSSYLQCDGVYGREVSTTASSGQNQIALTTAEGVTVGDYVQFNGVIPGTNSTTVTAINGSTVTLSANLTAVLPAARTLIFVKSGNNPGSDNKEFCVIPLNTAPPFEGTDIGLKTPSTQPNLTVAKLTFNNLKISLPNNNVTAISPPTNSTKYFPITYGSTTYKALIV